MTRDVARVSLDTSLRLRRECVRLPDLAQLSRRICAGDSRGDAETIDADDRYGGIGDTVRGRYDRSIRGIVVARYYELDRVGPIRSLSGYPIFEVRWSDGSIVLAQESLDASEFFVNGRRIEPEEPYLEDDDDTGSPDREQVRLAGLVAEMTRHAAQPKPGALPPAGPMDPTWDTPRYRLKRFGSRKKRDEA